MNWLDYREKLGIGFNDTDKFIKLRNIFCTYIKSVQEAFNLDLHYVATKYSIEVGAEYIIMLSDVSYLANDFRQAKSLSDLLSKFIVFSNIFATSITKEEQLNLAPRTFLVTQLKKWNIAYELVKDKDGVYIFPKGAKELDNALVSEPLEWLIDYPTAHKTFCIALKQYSDGIYTRDVADNFRKTLEAFMQEYLENSKNLDNNIDGFLKYLGSKNVDGEINGLFKNVIGVYKNFNNKNVKHNDKIDPKLLEFLMYQTGLLIRMAITVKNT